MAVLSHTQPPGIPVEEAAKIIKTHQWEISNAIIPKVSNGPAESSNNRIKTVKVRSR